MPPLGVAQPQHPAPPPPRAAVRACAAAPSRPAARRRRARPAPAGSSGTRAAHDAAHSWFGVQGVLSAVAGTYAPRVIGRFGPRRTLVGSLVGQGTLIAALLGLGTGSWSVWLATAAVSLASMCHLGAIISYGITVTSGVPDEEQGLATGLVTSTQQVGLTVGIPLLGVLATTSDDLLSGVHTVLALDTVIVLAAAVLVATGLRVRSGAVEAEPVGAR